MCKLYSPRGPMFFNFRKFHPDCTERMLILSVYPLWRNQNFQLISVPFLQTGKENLLFVENGIFNLIPMISNLFYYIIYIKYLLFKLFNYFTKLFNLYNDLINFWDSILFKYNWWNVLVVKYIQQVISCCF